MGPDGGFSSAGEPAEESDALPAESMVRGRHHDCQREQRKTCCPAGDQKPRQGYRECGCQPDACEHPPGALPQESKGAEKIFEIVQKLRDDLHCPVLLFFFHEAHIPGR